MVSYSRLLKVLQQNNLPQPEHLANQILNDYYTIDSPDSNSLFAAIEVLGKEVAIGKQLTIYRDINQGFRIMGDFGHDSVGPRAVSLSNKHEMADMLIRLAKKVVER